MPFSDFSFKVTNGSSTKAVFNSSRIASNITENRIKQNNDSKKNKYLFLFTIIFHGEFFNYRIKQICFFCTEAAVQWCSVKKVFLEISQMSQENICVSLFFNKEDLLINLFINKETLTQMFSCEFCEISKCTFFTEHLWWLLCLQSSCLLFSFP